MSSALDLNLLPLVSSAGQVQTVLPGVHMATPPRRPARGRHADRLIFYLSLVGNAPMTTERQEQLLARLAQTYYKTSGGVTTAMRAVVEALNHFLLERNLRGSSNGQQAAGILSLAVVRGEYLYLALCGPAHAYLISASGVEHFHDSQAAVQGLGLSRAASLRYFQSDFNSNDTLLLAVQPPASWSAADLGSLHGQGPESLRRRLLSQVEADLQAVLIQAKAGTGKNFLLRTKPSPTAPTPSPIAGIEDREKIVVPSETASESILSVPAAPLVTMAEQAIPASAPAPEVEPIAVAAPPITEIPPTRKKVSFQPASIPGKEFEQETPLRRGSSKITSKLAALIPSMSTVGGALGTIFNKLARNSRNLLIRMLPGEALFTLPSSVMAFIAVAIPLVVVTIASVIYFRSGRASQFEYFFNQAQQAAVSAQTQTEPQSQRTAWGTVLALLDQAENYETTPDSQSLRAQAVFVLDELEGVKRLDYQPAVRGGWPTTFHITHMIATGSDLFVLDQVSGSIARAYSVARGFERDDAFQCGPGLAGSEQFGPFVDFLALPKGNQLNTTLLAMDASGNLLKCSQNGDMEAASLTPPPAGLGKLAAFAMDLDDLYVLDPENNAVWIYWKGKASEEPELFFSESVPPMKDVIGMAVDRSDLYLLHADGHLTMCTYSELGVSPTRCTDPLTYIDSRPGRENNPFRPGAPFTGILATQPPDPSLYFLEPVSQSIYQFSFRLLTFHRQFLPMKPLSSNPSSPMRSATSFTLSPDNRSAFLAIGNEVFYASMP